MASKNIFYDIQYKGFTIVSAVVLILYIASIFGLSISKPEYITTLNSFIKIYICLYLIYRFNPLWKKVDFSDLDRKIVFRAGLFILTTTAINTATMYYLNKAKTKLSALNVF